MPTRSAACPPPHTCGRRTPKRTATDTKSATASKDVQANVVLAGTTNFLAKYVNGADVGNSGVFEAVGGAVGIGTTVPLDRLHVRYNNNTGQFTGFAVQNTNAGALAYSGMLFYDHTNVLTQFQGYNNSTHEYRINNIARVSPGGAFNGTINFMIGNTSRFFVGSNGGVGIGTTSAGPGLEVSNSLTGALVASIAASTYGNNPFGGTFVARKARGTQAAPTAVQNGDQIALFSGVGQTTTHSGNLGNGMTVNAAENYTDAAQGTALNFFTTKRGTTTPVTTMTLDDAGNLGLGTSAPSSAVELVRTGSPAEVRATSYAALSVSDATFVTRIARGTSAAPAAVQFGDELGAFGTTGYGATQFGQFAAGIGGIAAENWTDTAQGAALLLAATPLGSNEAEGNMVILPGGNVGIGLSTASRRSPTNCRSLATSEWARPAPTAVSRISAEIRSLARAHQTGASRKTSRHSIMCSIESLGSNPCTTSGVRPNFLTASSAIAARMAWLRRTSSRSSRSLS